MIQFSTLNLVEIYLFVPHDSWIFNVKALGSKSLKTKPAHMIKSSSTITPAHWINTNRRDMNNTHIHIDAAFDTKWMKVKMNIQRSLPGSNITSLPLSLDRSRVDEKHEILLKVNSTASTTHNLQPQSPRLSSRDNTKKRPKKSVYFNNDKAQDVQQIKCSHIRVEKCADCI